MIDTKLLRQKILDLAIRGKLVPQNPDDEPASVLLEKIRQEKSALVKAGKIKKDKHESFIFRGEDKHYYEQIDGKPTDITEEIPFDLPASWAWARLSTLCNYGVCDSETAENIPNTAWILDLEDIEKDTGRLLSRVTKAMRPTTSSKHKFSAGVVLYSKLRTYLNKVLVAQEGGYCTSEILPLDFGMLAIPEYAKNVLMSKMFLDYTAQCGYGVKMPRLGTEDGRRALFPLPPLTEQKRIISQIESLFAEIDKIDKDSVDLESALSLAKQKVLDLAIRGKLVPQNPADEPASELLKRIKAEKEALIKTGKIKRDKHESYIFRGDDNRYYEKIGNLTEDITAEIPYDIPEKWSWCRLGTLVNLTMGQSPAGETINTQGKGIEFHQGKLFFGEKNLQHSPYTTTTPERIAPKNSLLICVRAPVGIVNFTNREVCIGRGLAAIESFSAVPIMFLWYWIFAHRNVLLAKATGSTFVAVTVDQVKNLLLPLPPLSEQRRIHNCIAQYMSILESAE